MRYSGTTTLSNANPVAHASACSAVAASYVLTISSGAPDRPCPVSPVSVTTPRIIPSASLWNVAITLMLLCMSVIHHLDGDGRPIEEDEVTAVSAPVPEDTGLPAAPDLPATRAGLGQSIL